jgi:hypothetical protein
MAGLGRRSVMLELAEMAGPWMREVMVGGGMVKVSGQMAIRMRAWMIWKDGQGWCWDGGLGEEMVPTVGPVIAVLSWGKRFEFWKTLSYSQLPGQLLYSPSLSSLLSQIPAARLLSTMPRYHPALKKMLQMMY